MSETDIQQTINSSSRLNAVLHLIDNAFVRKLMNIAAVISVLLTVTAYLIASSYKEDTTKIPVFAINLLEQPAKKAIADTVKSPIEQVEQTALGNDESKTAVSLLEPNDFNLLNRKITKYSALNIIDPLPVLTMSYFGNKVPVISKDGELPWKAYAKPYNRKKNKGKIKIAILISHVGLDEELTQRVINAFGDNVSLAFSPYTKNMKELVNKARTYGKETYLDIPLDIENGDPGPYGIMKENTSDENFSRFTKAIGQGIAISGLVNIIEGKTTLPEDRIHKIISLTNQHGLLYIGSQMAENNETVINYDKALFNNLNRSALKQELKSFMEIINRKKQGLLIVDCRPSALAETLNFMDSLATREDIVFVPVSALVKEAGKQEI